MPLWHEPQPWMAFDLETTGVDVETDRVVSGSTIFLRPGEPLTSVYTLIAVEIDIPAGAQAVHGISTEQARATGLPTVDGLMQIQERLHWALTRHIPVVGMNLAYDLTLIDRELRRHGLTPLTDRLHREVGPILDVRVLDKQMDPRRAGKRQLGHLAAHYRVKHEAAHHSDGDAMAAARIAWRMARLTERGERPWARLANLDPWALHRLQAEWFPAQCNSLRAHFDRNKKEHDGVDGSWPMRPFGRVEAT